MPVSPRFAQAFGSLRHHNYRLLWSGSLISQTGDWLDQIALNWLVLEQTGSAYYLGLVNLCRALPILLLTLVGGAVADRVDRRRLLMLTQASAMCLAVLLAGMVFLDLAPIWAILLVATLRGGVFAFNLPARQSLIPLLVPRSDLASAIALNSITINATKVLGPALAGVLIALWGTGVCFALNAVSFIAVLWTVSAMRFETIETKAPAGAPESLIRSIGSGVQFVASNRVILLLVLVALVPTFFAQPYLHLLPIYAYQVFESGPVGLGIMTSCAAVGSVLGALATAASRSAARSGLTMLVLLTSFGILLFAFALNPNQGFALVLLVAMGATFGAYNTTHSTLLQLLVPEQIRGRVLSVLFVNRSLVSLGAAAAAMLASIVGVGVATALMAIVVIAFGVSLLCLAPAIRRLRE